MKTADKMTLTEIFDTHEHLARDANFRVTEEMEGEFFIEREINGKWQSIYWRSFWDSTMAREIFTGAEEAQPIIDKIRSGEIPMISEDTIFTGWGEQPK